MSWYMKGQSNYDNGSNFHMGLYFDVNGFASGDYVTLVMPDDVSQGDPFMTVAASTQPWNPGSQELEFGLWDHYRIKVSASGIHGWHYASGDWFDLFGGGGGAEQLSDLSDVSSVVYTAGYVLRANGSGYVSAQLAHGDLSDAPTSAHHVRYADSEAVSAVGTADDYVKNTGDTVTGSLIIACTNDGKLTLKATDVGGTPGTPEGGWNYIQFYDMDGDRQGYFGIDNTGNFQFSPEVAGAKIEMEAEVNLHTHKIINLVNGVGAQDAMAFGQKYTDADARSAIAYYVTSQSEFNSAITSIGTGFGIIILYASTITLSAPLNVNGGGHYKIVGYGDKTVIDIGGNWKAFYITSAVSCELKDFKIDATGLTSTTTDVINIVEASNNRVIVNNVKIIGDNVNGYGIRFTSNNVVIQNCWIEGVRNAITTSGGDYCKILGNTCYNNNYHGIYLDGGDHCIVSGNHTYSNTRDGIYLSDSASYNVISGNYIYNNYVGIHLYSNANVNTITGNDIYNNTEEGIYVRTSHNCNIVGNNCNSNGTCGIWLNASSNNTITGNTCNDNDFNDSNNFGGVYMSGNSDQNTITGNTCNNNNNIGAGNGHGIHIASDTCNNNTVAGNTLLGNDVNYSDSGTGTKLFGDNTAYNATSWNNDLGTATKNALRNKFEAHDALPDVHHAKQHGLDSTTEHTINANTNFNATTSKHGFLKQLDNVATNFMNGQGNWAVPSGGSAGMGIASNTLRYSNDSTKSTQLLVQTKLKETKVCNTLVRCRIYYEYRNVTGTGPGVTTQIRVNGVAQSGYNSTTSATWQPATYDLTISLAYDDLVQVYGWCYSTPSAYTCEVRNLRIKFDEFVNQDP